jgi:sugar lactone lactonase YvrE
MKVIIWVLGGIVAALIVVVLLALMRSNIDPVEFVPGPNMGLTGSLAPNDAIKSATLILEGVGVGPEDIAIGLDGWMYTGYRDGRIVRFRASGEHEEFANTGGYPLGMRVDRNNNLIVADADKGLLSISQSGAIEVLAISVDGQKMKFVDGLDIAEDGTIWFTDASTRFGRNDVTKIFLEGRATGRLLSFSPDSGEVKVHLDDLNFANGVAVAPGQEYVLVSETAAGQVRRYWLEGSEAGTSDIFVDGLPGTPDNISVDEDGFFWIGFPSIRDPRLDKLGDMPFVRRLLGALPEDALMPDRSYAFVVGFDNRGNVIQNLQHEHSALGATTGAVRVGKTLYITNLETDAIGEL